MNAPQPAPDGRQTILELNRLIAEARGFFHDLELVSAEILARSGLSPQERRMLMALRKLRRCTVPQLARQLDVSRQYVQVTVNDLEKRGLVEFMENPAHKRSRFLLLTAAAEEQILEIMAREGEALHHVAAGLEPERVRGSVEVLRLVRDRLAGRVG